MKVITVASVTALLFFGACAQWRTRTVGGTEVLTLPPNTKLMTVTWHGNDLWYLTRAMRSDEAPETYELKERSMWNIASGTVIIKERREK